MEQRSITFIGAGNMARSIIAGLVASGYAADKITATAPSAARREPLARDYGIHTDSDNLRAAGQADVIVLAVKPQLMESVCNELQGINFAGKLVISIAAGISVTRINMCGLLLISRVLRPKLFMRVHLMVPGTEQTQTMYLSQLFQRLIRFLPVWKSVIL